MSVKKTMKKKSANESLHPTNRTTQPQGEVEKSGDSLKSPSFNPKLPQDQSNGCRPTVYHAIAHAPHNLHENALVAVDGKCAIWDRPEPPPFASIFSLSPDEMLSDRPKICIHVHVTDDDIYFCDGLVAFESNARISVSAVPFPELCKALRINQRDFSPLITSNELMKPYAFVKLWHLGDMEDIKLPNRIGASAALTLLFQWSGMNAKNMSLKKRMHRVLGKMANSDLDLAQEDRFGKFCRAIGLKRTDTRDFKREFDGLWAACREAQWQTAQKHFACQMVAGSAQFSGC